MAQIFDYLSQGGLPATLLFLQVGIVTALGLTLVALVVRRLRRASHDTPDRHWPNLDEEAWLHEVLAERHAQHDAELVDENRSLRERIRFLEAKNLELEILGEQLDGLAALKADNERLREKIQELEAKLGKQSA